MALTISAARPVDRAEEIPTPGALAFSEELHQRFAATCGDLVCLSKDDTGFLTTPAYELVG